MTIPYLLRRELELFRENRRMKVSAFVVIAFIPFLYAYTFLSSIWDPFQNLKHLPVAYVNLDQGVRFRNKDVRLADEVVKEMLRRENFRYLPAADEAAARESLRNGDIYFALVFPADFSAKALPGYHTEPGVVKLLVSEGLGFTAALIGRRMGNELTYKLNQQLNTRRWEIVFEQTGQAGISLKHLRGGLEKLRGGSKQLAQGESEISSHLLELNEGLKKFAEGAARLKEGASQLKAQGGKIPLFGGKVSEGAGKLEGGAGLLEAGLKQAVEGGEKLSAGQKQLAEGSIAVASGVDLIYGQIPMHVDALSGDALGLAASVAVVQESLTEGSVTYGDAFAPYFVALSLWLGIVVCTFFFYFRRLRNEMQSEPRWKSILQKLFLPALLAASQAIVLAIGTYHSLGLHTLSFFAYLIICLQGSMVFLLIIFSFILIFRDAGRLVALLFFVFQLAAAGGAFPIEMSGGFFQYANPFLPMTNIVKALRAANLGAYGGHPGIFLLKAWLAAFAILLLAYAIARWKFVPDSEYTLAADI